MSGILDLVAFACNGGSKKDERRTVVAVEPLDLAHIIPEQTHFVVSLLDTGEADSCLLTPKEFDTAALPSPLLEKICVICREMMFSSHLGEVKQPS